MSKENNLHDYFADLYQGIASKKPDASKNPQDFRAEIEALGTIGGIRGVVEQYTVNAGATVNAGDFVEFVNAWNKGEIISTNPTVMSACKLDNTRVLVAYIYEDDSDYYNAYVAVATVENDTIAVGAKYRLDRTAWIRYISVDALTDDKAVVGISNSSNTKEGHLHPLKIEGDKISIGTKYTLGNLSETIKVVALTSTRFLSVYTSYTDSYSPTATPRMGLFQLADMSISKIVSYELPYKPGDLLKLTPSKVWAVLKPNSSSAVYQCYGAETNAITQGKQVSGSSTYSSAAALSETLVVTVCTDGSIQAVAIDGTNQTLGNLHPLAAVSVGATSVVALNTHQALVAYLNKSDGKSYAVVATVDGTDITLGAPVNYTDYSDINQLIAFSDSSVVNIFANEFIAGVGMEIGDKDSYKGGWRLNETGFHYNDSCDFNFKSNGEEFVGIRGSFTGQASACRYHLDYLYANGTQKRVWTESDSAYWTKVSTAYQTITVVDEPDEKAQTWLGKRGSKIVPSLEINQLTSTYVQPATSRLHNVGVARTAGTAGEKIDVYCVGEE